MVADNVNGGGHPRREAMMQIYNVEKMDGSDFERLQEHDVCTHATAGCELEIIKNYGDVQKVRILVSANDDLPVGTICLWSEDGLWVNPDFG